MKKPYLDMEQRWEIIHLPNTTAGQVLKFDLAKMKFYRELRNCLLGYNNMFKL